MVPKGVVAAGHESTVQAAEQILREGGNAFDAIVAAHFAACVAEPVLASLGGGGFLLAAPEAGRPVVYDFFAHTPLRRRPPGDLDFRPIVADFGTATQEFHIGLGTVATPGALRGMAAIHADLCSLPLRELIAPAIDLARGGVALNRLQAYIFSVVAPIYTATPEARAIYGCPDEGSRLIGAGHTLYQPQLADTLEAIAAEGPERFYRGEIAASIVEVSRAGGGLLTREDLASYRVERRPALEIEHRASRIVTNPPPSSGGILIAFALELLKSVDLAAFGFGSPAYLRVLAEALGLSNRARLEALAEGRAPAVLDPGYVARYRREILGRAASLRGTTHISVIDARGNLASMTVSNGEGCGHLVPGTGIMLNNMLGEQDLNPGGFHRWREGQRMSSMMAPTMVQFPDGTRIATGSGGSNRIRSALLQVLINLLDFGVGVEPAVTRPRIHLEGRRLSVEGGFAPAAVEALLAEYPEHDVWEGLNLFFGGAHTVLEGPAGLEGVGDPRRGGVGRVVY